ncbi:MAG: DNA polymerase domain-containing protein [Verrucomicrobiota bacterium]|nr:DNA polymerase domain-containing protein [Verrucomicrobiota bacterium]
MTAGATQYDPLLFGRTQEEGLVAVEHVEQRGKPDEVILFFRRGERIEQRAEPFRPFLVAELRAIGECPVPYERRKLQGCGPLNLEARFDSWRDWLRARDWLVEKTGRSPSTPEAPYLAIHDPIQQYLMTSGRTLFLGMNFEDVRRLQVDIECRTAPGFEFCNAEREGDAIIAIAVTDGPDWREVLSADRMNEKELLERFVALVRERDPDVIEGHNLFNFDLPYLAERVNRHGVKLALGRNGDSPRRRPSRFNAGERTIAYDRFDIFGRHVVDTLFLVHAYDIAHRSLGGFGLKEVAVHFGVASKDRVRIEGQKIGEVFEKEPARVARYVADDVLETREIGNILSRTYFAQTQMLPYSYQNVCARGSATKIDALMLREYCRAGQALPLPDRVRDFEGGYTDMFVRGVIENVHHCDVRSLYPSLMLSRKLAPGSDELGIFPRLLERLRAIRLEAKEKMKKSRDAAERTRLDALQTAFKVLINSFYGYLGFSQARFGDFDVAERITADGRELLKFMIAWLRERGAMPVEIDTDGIYFVPPAGLAAQPAMEAFRADFARSLPEGIEVEFDGEYRSMYSYKMKNYALLTDEGAMTVKGAALKSRGLEPFQRDFLEQLIRLKLEGRAKKIPALKRRYEKDIRERKWPIKRLAKTETLQDAPVTYAAKQSQGKRARSAVYELALKSGRPYRAGDQISYYVTGTKKSVAVHESARLVAEWNAGQRDENVAYYLSKLEALCRKFGEEPTQGELGLGTAGPKDAGSE